MIGLQAVPLNGNFADSFQRHCSSACFETSAPASLCPLISPLLGKVPDLIIMFTSDCASFIAVGHFLVAANMFDSECLLFSALKLLS